MGNLLDIPPTPLLSDPVVRTLQVCLPSRWLLCLGSLSPDLLKHPTKTREDFPYIDSFKKQLKIFRQAIF